MSAVAGEEEQAWIRRIAGFRRVASIDPPSGRTAPIRVCPDFTGRLVGLDYGTSPEHGGLCVADLSDGRILLHQPRHNTIVLLPFHGGLASQDHFRNCLVLMRMGGGGLTHQACDPFEPNSTVLEDVSPAGDRVFLRRPDGSEIAVWPSLERVAWFGGSGHSIDWEVRRVLSLNADRDRLLLRDFDGEDLDSIPLPVPALILERMSAGLWARYGRGMGLVQPLAGRDLTVFPGSPATFRSASVSPDLRRLRVYSDGKPRRIALDLTSGRVELPKGLAGVARTHGTNWAVFHPVVDLIADHRARAICRFDGTPVLSLGKGQAMCWSADGTILAALRESRVDIWR